MLAEIYRGAAVNIVVTRFKGNREGVPFTAFVYIYLRTKQIGAALRVVALNLYGTAAVKVGCIYTLSSKCKCVFCFILKFYAFLDKCVVVAATRDFSNCFGSVAKVFVGTENLRCSRTPSR